MLFMSSRAALSLGQLVEDYDMEIRRVLTRRLGCVDTAADILQETYRRRLTANFGGRPTIHGP